MQAEEMIRRVKKAFVDNLPNLEWMDNQTRIAAIGKVCHRCHFCSLHSSFEPSWTFYTDPMIKGRVEPILNCDIKY